MAQDIKITPGSGIPQISFVGSGTSANTIELNVQSGSDLSFSGSQGEIFTVDHDGVGSTELLTVATGIALQRNTPATTTDKLYNVAGALYFDGSEVGGGSSYTAGTGLVLVGTEFNTANTGVFDELWLGNKVAGVGTGYMDHLIFNRELVFGQTCAIGVGAGKNMGQYSICIGNNAGGSIADYASNYSVYIGRYAGSSAAGALNVAIGSFAAASMSDTSTQNISIGYQAGQNQAGGDDSVYMGTQAGYYSNGDNSIFLGKYAGRYCVGTNNIEIVTSGAATSILDDYSNKIHIENTIVGDTDTRRLAIGLVSSGDVSPDATLEIKPSGTATVGMIVQAEASHTANLTEWQDSSETVLASVAADGATSVSGLLTAATGIALQRNTPATTTDKLYNVAGDLYFDGSAVGGGSSYTAGTGLTLVGTEFNTADTGVFDELWLGNKVAGVGTGYMDHLIFNSELGAGQTCAIGVGAGTNIGQYSICIGNYAGNGAGPGGASYNIFIGGSAGQDNDGDLNIAIGHIAGYNVGAASTYNTSVGYEAGRNADGNYNVHLGKSAGYYMNGDNNILIGKYAGRSIVGDHNIEIVTETATAAQNWKSILFDSSNKINIAGVGSVIVGDTATQRLAIGGVGSGDLSPDATLEIKPSGATDVGLIVQGATSQSASLTEWQDSSETVLASVAADGAISASGAITAATGIALQRNTPATTTDKLYNVGGDLYFDGSAVVAALAIRRGLV